MDPHHCSLCPFFCYKQDELLNHVIRRHQHDANFVVYCSASACGASFRNYHSFKSHVQRCHGNKNDDMIETDTFDGTPFQVVESEVCSSAAAEAAYILNLKARHRLSQSAIRDVCVSTKALFRVKLLQLWDSSANCEVDDSVTDSLFSGLETVHKQERFFRENFGYVTPCRYKMGSVDCASADGKTVLKPHFGYFVPMKEQLRAVLSMPEVQRIFVSVNSSDYMYDFCDADYLRHHSLQISPTTLNFCIYTDDFEVVNPIGSHRKKHKLTAFYWTLLNIPPECRSKLSAIQLLALAKSVDIRRYGLHGFLQDFIDTMFELRNGVNFCIDGHGIKTYTGFLVCALADTPAAQLLGGFKEGVGAAVSPCRSCDAKRTCLSSICTAAECPLRDLQEHTDRVSFLEGQNKQSHKYWSKLWGINGKSVLADVPGFDVTKCILHDPMHVILEGIAKVEMKKMLNVFVFQKKYFTLAALNRAIKDYPFSNTELRDKPEAIDRQALEQKSIFSQTAAAMKNLIINFPFIVGDLIPEDDECWQNFIILLQILTLSLSPITSINTPDVLENLVARHNRNFVLLYSESSFTPKFHYLVHFSSQMRLFGPLHNHWCMRFESKNGFFKLQRWFNYKNLPKSLSFYHQRWMCLQMIQSSGSRSNVYLYAGDDVHEGNVVPVCTLHGMADVFEHTEQSPEFVMCSPKIVVNGLVYEKGTVLLSNFESDLMFMEVENIVIQEQVKYLLCTYLEVKYFDVHRSAFVVEKCATHCTVRTEDLRYKWPQVTHDNFVMLKHSDDIWML